MRVGLTALYGEQGLTLLGHVGWITVSLIGKKKEKKKAKKPKKTEKPEKPPRKSKTKRSLDIGELIDAALKAVRRFWRGIRMDVLELDCTVGGSDAAAAAILYGRLCWVIAALLPQLKPKRQKINLGVDFALPATKISSGKVKLTIRLGTLLAIGFSLLLRLPKIIKRKAADEHGKQDNRRTHERDHGENS